MQVRHEALCLKSSRSLPQQDRLRRAQHARRQGVDVEMRSSTRDHGSAFSQRAKRFLRETFKDKILGPDARRTRGPIPGSDRAQEFSPRALLREEEVAEPRAAGGGALETGRDDRRGRLHQSPAPKSGLRSDPPLPHGMEVLLEGGGGETVERNARAGSKRSRRGRAVERRVC
ncbi:hypothetical protein CEXT_555621 [Caerostris extrusa]|uniref:Uncharacterized protein n=1 Tax=Caerostris extrusa TaxID=172846 RepID=A0AAV4SNQ8_CAEEX|nr:hypothetical protein CEXT_555621 [Caerostris extrusa]